MHKLRHTTCSRMGGRLAGLLAGALLVLPAMAADYVQAPGSMLVFAGKYDGEVFVGKLPGFDTRLSFDPAQPEDARLRVRIPLVDADTGNGDRDDTLLGEAFFNVEAFPAATYEADGFRHLGGNRYAADGTLTLRGVSKPVALEFTWTPGARPLLDGEATVPRLAFGVGDGDWADTGLLPDDIAVSTKVYFKPAN